VTNINLGFVVGSGTPVAYEIGFAAK